MRSFMLSVVVLFSCVPQAWAGKAIFCNPDGTVNRIGSSNNYGSADFIYTVPCPPNGANPDAVCIDEATYLSLKAIPNRNLICRDTDNPVDGVFNLVEEMTQAEKDGVDSSDQASNTLLTRSAAESQVDGFIDTGVLIRALALVVMDEINILRADVDAMSKESNQITDINRPARTINQLKTAIKNKINAGDAD